MNIDALIFDFDGVIVDSEPLHCKAFQDVLGPLGIQFTWEEYLRDYVGFDDRDALRFAFSYNGLPLEPDRMDSLILEKAAEFTRLASAPELSLYPGVQELLDAFKGSLPIAICSGALRQDIVPVIERFGIGDAFDLMITADQVERSKPDPESYLMTLAALEHTHGSLKKKQCVVIEDTPAGLASAKGAGLFTIGVTHTHPAESLSDADCLTDSLPEVLAFLKQE
jgi:HAD superfamily hydrolase (TIGR01509 family)